MGVGGRFGFPVLGAENESANATLVDPVVQASMPINIQKRDSVAHDTLLSTSSSTSSSEGSPVRQLGETVDAMALADELERGRDRATTPIQLINSSDAQWIEILQPGEELIFHAPVELKSRARRLTATLLPIPATQNRPKLRHLVLTSRRLICTKLRHNHQLTVKGEALLRPVVSSKEGKEDKRDRDTRPIITGVMAKGQKAFIVTTVSSFKLRGYVTLRYIYDDLRAENRNNTQRNLLWYKDGSPNYRKSLNAMNQIQSRRLNPLYLPLHLSLEAIHGLDIFPYTETPFPTQSDHLILIHIQGLYVQKYTDCNWILYFLWTFPSDTHALSFIFYDFPPIVTLSSCFQFTLKNVAIVLCM